jgi:hypothetical protein
MTGYTINNCVLGNANIIGGCTVFLFEIITSNYCGVNAIQEILLIVISTYIRGSYPQ